MRGAEPHADHPEGREVDLGVAVGVVATRPGLVADEISETVEPATDALNPPQKTGCTGG